MGVGGGWSKIVVYNFWRPNFGGRGGGRYPHKGSVKGGVRGCWHPPLIGCRWVHLGSMVQHGLAKAKNKITFSNTGFLNSNPTTLSGFSTCVLRAVTFWCLFAANHVFHEERQHPKYHEKLANNSKNNAKRGKTNHIKNVSWGLRRVTLPEVWKIPIEATPKYHEKVGKGRQK